MDYRQLSALTNAYIVGLGNAMVKMGVNIHLIWSGLIQGLTGESKLLIKELGFNIEGNDIKSIVESFAENVTKIGIAQVYNVVETSDDRIVVEVAYCSFMPATQIFAESYKDDAKFVPPCAINALLGAVLLERLNKTIFLNKWEYKTDQNACHITMEVSDT